MTDFTSVWDEAGDSAEAEQGLRALTAARVQAAAYWPFLSAAVNRDDFVNRLALKDAEIADCAEAQGITFEALVRSLAEDFHAVEAARVEAKKCSSCGDTMKQTAKGDGSNPLTGVDRYKCENCSNTSSGKKEGVRALAIFKVTAADDSTAYYVVDEDTDKKVGGPYDDEAGARAAISGGDVEGDNLTVSKGGGDDSDSDSDDDDDDKKKGNPFAKKDDGDSDSEKDDSDDDGDDDKKGNPFAKKESSAKCEHCGKDGASGTDCSCKRKGGSFNLCSSCKSEHMKENHGSKKESAHKVAHPGFGMGMDEEVEDHTHSGGQHPTPTITPHDHKVVMKMREDSRSGKHPDTMCDGCGDSFDSRSMHHMDKNCPHCGADPSYHNDADDYDDDQDPHYGDQGGSEDNHGDPYGKFDEGGAWDQHRHGSLFPVIALQDGEDPLQWVVDSVPSGEGEPEKPDEHNETLALTGSLIDRFSQVFTATVGQ